MLSADGTEGRKVEHHHVGRMQRGLADPGGAVRGSDHVISAGHEGDAQHTQESRVVVDDEHLGHQRSDPMLGSALFEGSDTAGSEKDTRAPPPGASSAEMVPP